MGPLFHMRGFFPTIAWTIPRGVVTPRGGAAEARALAYEGREIEMQIERRQRRRRLACVLRVCVCACVPQCASGALRCSNARQGGASDEKQRRCAAAAAPSWREGACVMLMKAVRKPCSTLSKPVKPKSSVTCLARTSAHAHGRTHAHARTHARTYART